MSVTDAGVTAANDQAAWTRACAHIRSALGRRGTHRLEDVFGAWQAGQAQIWRAPAATIVTEVRLWPLCRELNYWLAGGEPGGEGLQQMMQMEPQIEAFGRASGCVRAVTMAVRRGGAEVLRARGWAEQAVIMTKDL